MLRGTLAIGLLAVVLIAPVGRGADVSVDLIADLSGSVSIGSTVPYEIHVAISPGASGASQGLCLFVLDLQSDLGVDQQQVLAFAPAIAAGFDGISLQFGVPDGRGGVRDIGAAQSCNVAEDTVLGIGLAGQTLVARGELQMPTTTGTYTVRIRPLQVSLIAPDGDGAISPDTTDGGSLAITVGPAGDDDGDAGTDGLNDNSGDPGTDGLNDNGSDVGTDGSTDDDNTNSGDGAGGGTGSAGPTPALCGDGIFAAALLLLGTITIARAASPRSKPAGLP